MYKILVIHFVYIFAVIILNYMILGNFYDE